MYNLSLHYSLILAFFWASYAVLPNYAGVYLLDHNLNNTEIGFIFSSANILSAIIQIVLCTYADSEHSPSVKKIILILIVLFLAFSDAIPLSSESSFFLAVCYGLAITLMQSMIPLTNSLGTLSAGAGNTLNFGVARGVGSVAYAAASLFIGKMLARTGTSLIPIASIFLYIAMGLCILRFPFQKITVKSEKHVSRDFLKRYPSYTVILIAAVFLYSSHSIINNFLFQIISSKGGNSESLGIVYAIAALSELPMMFCFSRLSRRISSGKWLVISGSAFFIKSVCMLIVPDVRGVYFIQILQMLSYSAITVASVYYIDSIMEPQDKIKGQAWFAVTGTIGVVLTTAIGGYILDTVGVTPLLVSAILFSAAGMILMYKGVYCSKPC